VQISFNLPIFFWLKQNEDIKRAGLDLEAAREDLLSVRTRTAAEVTILFRHAQFDYQNAIVFRDSIVPKSTEAFESALTDYREQKAGFGTLAYLRNQLNLARANYLQAVDSFVADRIALEQEIGESLPK